MKRNTLITTALGAVAVVALLAWAFAPRPLAVEVATVATGRYEQAIVEDGRTRVRERYTVAAPLNG
ncbi:MAG: efflux transporter periplasmic adaptor subunit, partial [Aquabacterium sp.]|nr:efflux transporter periplasmic adaptor subunit [Aquabacterium sp.]